MHKLILSAKSASRLSMPSPCTVLGVQSTLDANQCFGRYVCLKHLASTYPLLAASKSHVEFGRQIASACLLRVLAKRSSKCAPDVKPALHLDSEFLGRLQKTSFEGRK